MPWEHKTHNVYLTTGKEDSIFDPEPDGIQVLRGGKWRDIAVMEEEGFEMTSFLPDPDGGPYGIGIFKRFVQNQEPKQRT